MVVISKQQTSQRYIYKIHTGRLRRSKWDLTLPMAEARRNNEMISLADSQVIRWLDELNGLTDVEKRSKSIKKEIKLLRKEQNSVKNKRKLKQLYADLDSVQFRPDYLCLIIDKEKDYHRACKGFSVNGIKYKRLLGTNGGIKNKTIVFLSEKHVDEIKRRIENGRDKDKKLVPAKLEAYKALTCSASTPVSMPKGLLVVNDCETKFISDIIYLNDEEVGEPVMEERKQVPVQLNESDGYGLMLPSLAERWSKDLGLDYLVSGVNTRFAWEKGMVFTFDFLEFAENVAGKHIIKDAWGNNVDIRNVELMLTTSMVKLWDSYDSCEDYLRNCKENGYTFGITKTCPKELEAQRTLNYQFIQSYDLDDDDIEELIKPTMDEIREVLQDDRMKSILFLCGMGLNEKNVNKIENNFIKALMIEPKMIEDPFVQGNIYKMIKNRINEAKVGVLNIHGNYSIVSGDPYSLCQSVFGMEVTGLLKEREIYNAYWTECESRKLACFRAPMTCHRNIRAVYPNRSKDAKYWYRYMNTCTIFNSWDTAAHALNGMDKDGDLVMLTDNAVLVRKLRDLPALMCVQRKAKKRIVTEEDIIRSNIDSFGDDIGKTTNWITSMFDVQAKYEKDSPEYKELEYRIMCGQLFQQNAIDKAKGIIAKPMPREWHDHHAVNMIDNPKKREFYHRICADKKPYFMRYIYPDLMKRYNKYIKNTHKKSLREFGISINDLLNIPEDKLTKSQKEFIYYYKLKMPVQTNNCVMNRICRRFEEEFDHFLSRKKVDNNFDYTILKSSVEYSKSQYNAVLKLYESYTKRLQNYAIFANLERVDECESFERMSDMREDFIRECAKVCPDRYSLCDMVLDICYTRSSTKRFAWEMCGDEIIQNLLERNNDMLSYPTLDPDGNLIYGGYHFRINTHRLEEFGEY